MSRIDPGAGTGRAILQPWLYWGQRTEWSPDAAPSPERFYNCGPMALSMAIKYLSGVTVPADYIHDEIHGEGVVSGTTLEQMVWALDAVAGIPAAIVTMHSAEELRTATTEQVLAGRPWVELMYFQTVNQEPYHYRVGNGVDPFACYMADPWDGGPIRYGHAEHWNWSLNSFVRIDRDRKV